MMKENMVMSEDEVHPATVQSMEVADKIKPLLADLPSYIQGAILAQLFAKWLAGHQDLREPESKAILEFREKSLQLWIKFVRQLVPVAAEEIRANMK